ncbi:elongation factor P [Patescibacteria group bacterium]|nr:elongation factor P [Patescibacteria group bacterium]MBU1922522.1 elongation factor P [Patescibacteria group bacterium]
MSTTSDIKKGVVIKYAGELWIVADSQHVKMGRGGAFVRTKLRNVKSGKVIENTFKTGETIKIEELAKKKMQYLYKEGQLYNFMDPVSYEQISLPPDILGESAKYLKEGLEAEVLCHDDSPLALALPIKITYEVTASPEAVRGDSASGRVTKEIVLENELKIQAPLFIKRGDKIVVNTETGEYVERAKLAS